VKHVGKGSGCRHGPAVVSTVGERVTFGPSERKGRIVKRRSLRLIAVGAATAVGTALVYFLDPVAGPDRRRVARDWVVATVRGLLIEPAAEPTVRDGGPVEGDSGEAGDSPGESHWTEPAEEREPVRYPAAYEVAAGQDFTTRFVESEREEEDLAEAPVAVEAATVDRPSRSPMEVVRWERGEYSVGDEVDRKRAVLYLEGEPAQPSRVVAYDRTGEPEPPLVRPRRRDRLPSRLLAGASAAAAASAIVLASWAVVLEHDSEPSSAATPLGAAERRAISLLTEPGVRRVPVQGTSGTLFVLIGKNGKATLVGVSKLGRAPEGKTYEAWVIDRNVPTPAGIFSGSQTVFDLTARVPRGATVAVTLERAGGVPAPTSKPIFAAETS
jgi:hypothetical protein